MYEEYIGHGNETPADTPVLVNRSQLVARSVTDSLGIVRHAQSEPSSLMTAPASSPAYDASGGSATSVSWPTDPHTGLPLPITTQQWAAIQDAVQRAIAQAGSKFSAGSVDATITSILQGTGLFTQTELDAIGAGEQNAEPHGSGFTETNKGGGNTSGFVSSWVSNIRASLLAAWQSAVQSATPPTPTPPDTTTGGSSTIDPTVAGLIAALSGNAGGTTSTANQPLPVSTPYYAPASGGPPMVPLLLLAGAGGLGYWWWHKHHASAPHD